VRFALLARSTIVVAALWPAMLLPAVAQPTWPQHGVKIITPLPPGTGVDLVARLYADRFAQRWGQPVVVENRVGAEGIMATSSFVAACDDHALLLSIGAPFTIAPFAGQKLQYDPESDVTPIALTAEQYLAIGANKALGITTLAELEARARAEPGKLVWSASTGLPQLSFTSFVKRAGLDMRQPTYRDTSSPLADLGEGRLHVFVSGMAAIRPQIESGKAIFLALLGRNRNAAAPETPTVGEAGYPHMAVIGVTALFGWKGMPTELRDKIAADVRTIAGDEALRAKLATSGLTPRFEPAPTLVRLLAEQKATVADILGKSASEPLRQ
jgi:tripartite-type tricarboxylate transporter receptor subunit TctC